MGTVHRLWTVLLMLGSVFTNSHKLDLTGCPVEIHSLVLSRLSPEDLRQVLAASINHRQVVLHYLLGRMRTISKLVREDHSYRFYLEICSHGSLFLFEKNLSFSRLLAPLMDDQHQWTSRECPLYYWLVWSAISHQSGKIAHTMKSFPVLWHLNQEKGPFMELLLAVLGSIGKDDRDAWERFREFLAIVARSGNRFDNLIIKALYRTGHARILKKFIGQSESSEIMFVSRTPTIISPTLDVLVKEVVKMKDLIGFKFVLRRATRRIFKDWLPLCLLCIRRDFPEALLENMNTLLHPLSKQAKSTLLRASCRWISSGNYELICFLLRSGANPNEFMDLDLLLKGDGRTISRWTWLCEEMDLEHDFLGLNCRDILNQRHPLDPELTAMLSEYGATASLAPLDTSKKNHECLVKKFYKKAIGKSKLPPAQFYCPTINYVHRIALINGELVVLMSQNQIDTFPAGVGRVLRIGDTVARRYTILALSHFHVVLGHDDQPTASLIRLGTVLSFYEPSRQALLANFIEQ